MDELKGKALIAQSGGPTMVINQTLCGIALMAKKYPQITRVYGSIYSYTGILDQSMVDLTDITQKNWKDIAVTPGSALGSSRLKPKYEDCVKMFKIMKKHDIHYLFVIGGNDSADVARIINETSIKEDYNLACIHVPKTVDNDLMENDVTPGFPSAARFISLAFSGVNFDNRSLPGVYIGITMGRQAGFLTASSAAHRQYCYEGPHLIYLPERAFSIEKFLEDVKKTHKKYGRAIVAISEGIEDEKGIPILQGIKNDIEKDPHKNVSLSGSGALADYLASLVKDKLEIQRVRADTLGYPQRSFPFLQSRLDAQLAQTVGEHAVKFAADGGKDGSIVLQKKGKEFECGIVALEKVAGKTRKMPDEFINKEGNHITPAFLEYIYDLIGEDLELISHLKVPRVKKL